MKRLVVVNLLPLTTTQEGWLGALVVDVGPQVLLAGEGRGLSLLDGLIDLSLGLLVEFLRK